MNHIYQRVSTDNQDMRTQESACEKLSIELGGTEYKLWSDPDTSSRIPMEKRTGLQKMLKTIRRGDNVIVYKLDRLSRDVIEMVTTYRLIKSAGCNLYSSMESGCDNEFMMGLLGVFAQKERKDISDRIKSKLKTKKERGERVSRYPPYGYQFEDNIVIEDPHEQSVIKTARTLRDQGLSYRAIAKTLTQQGYRSRSGNPFFEMSISRMMDKACP